MNSNVIYWFAGYCEGIRQRPGKKLWGEGTIVSAAQEAVYGGAKGGGKTCAIDEPTLLTDKQIKWRKNRYMVQLPLSVDNWNG